MSTPIVIEDPEDPRVSEYRQMNDQAVRRRMEGDEYFLSEGWVSIDHLMQTEHRFRSVLLSPSRVTRFLPYTARSELDGVPIFVAEAEVMHHIVGFAMPRAVVMSLDRQPLVPVADLLATTDRVLVLEGLNDNENVGAIARAARAFNVNALLLSPTCTDPYYRRTVRVSMGEILHMRVARADRDHWPSVMEDLHAAGFATWAMTPGDHAGSIWEEPIPDRLAVMLGAEGPGLTQDMLDQATRQVRIPISRDVDSLNVGHAAAITLAAISAPRR